MPTRAQPDRAIAAAKLREAADLVKQYMPAGKDQTDVLRRINLEVARLGHDGRALCRRCGIEFTFNAARFAGRGFDPPRHCYECRQVRRWERAGAAPSWGDLPG